MLPSILIAAIVIWGAVAILPAGKFFADEAGAVLARADQALKPVCGGSGASPTETLVSRSVTDTCALSDEEIRPFFTRDCAMS
jgi:hypothetical protein